MNLLFIGDIFASPGRRIVAECLADGGHGAHEQGELAIVADGDADARKRGVEHAHGASRRDAPVALERRHDELFLLPHSARRRDELGGVDELARALAQRSTADEDVHAMLACELRVQADAPLGQFGNSGIGILRAPRYVNTDLAVSKRFDTVGSQYVLFRGEYDKRRDPVKPRTPAFLPPLPTALRSPAGATPPIR